MTAKHKNEVWTVGIDHSKRAFSIFNADGNWHKDQSYEANQSRARLIAAAPELLEALRMLQAFTVPMYEDSEPGDGVYEAFNKADAAIAKARGK